MKLILKNIAIVLSLVVAGTAPSGVHAQSLLPVPDSAMTRSTAKTGLNLSGFSSRTGGMNGAGTGNSSVDFLKNIGAYKLNLSNGLSLKTESSFNSLLNPGTVMNPNNLRRGSIMPKEELMYGQHFSFGASYNGLNNTLRGGTGGMNGRNPGLSLHAGISF